MGILIIGLAFVAGLLVADRLMTQDCDAAAANARGARAKAAGASPRVGAAPKAGPGDAVAVLPRACWGRVQDVVVGADGDYCYVVGLTNGETVELRGRELARG